MNSPALPRARRQFRLFEDLKPFEQRIELLCREHNVTAGKLGEEAGLSAETVPKLLRQARAGHKFPGSAETCVLLARRWNFSLEWFLDDAPLDANGRAPKPPASSPPKTRT